MRRQAHDGIQRRGAGAHMRTLANTSRTIALARMSRTLDRDTLELGGLQLRTLQQIFGTMPSTQENTTERFRKRDGARWSIYGIRVAI